MEEKERDEGGENALVAFLLLHSLSYRSHFLACFLDSCAKFTQAVENILHPPPYNNKELNLALIKVIYLYKNYQIMSLLSTLLAKVALLYSIGRVHHVVCLMAVDLLFGDENDGVLESKGVTNVSVPLLRLRDRWN